MVETIDRKTRVGSREERARGYDWDRSADHIRARSQNGCTLEAGYMTAPVSFRERSDSFPLHCGRRPYMALSGGNPRCSRKLNLHPLTEQYRHRCTMAHLHASMVSSMHVLLVCGQSVTTGAVGEVGEVSDSLESVARFPSYSGGDHLKSVKSM